MSSGIRCASDRDWQSVSVSVPGRQIENCWTGRLMSGEEALTLRLRSPLAVFKSPESYADVLAAAQFDATT
jgi:hypothetical protein